MEKKDRRGGGLGCTEREGKIGKVSPRKEKGFPHLT
jgi:hypothetical protein